MMGKILVFLLMTLALAKGEEFVRAKADINPDCKKSYSYKVYGKVKIAQQTTGGETLFHVRLEGLPPNTVHGFHVHQTGDIFTEGCKSTGGHYNPGGVVHGGKDDAVRHVGDLGNVKSDNTGKVDIQFSDNLAGLVGKHSIAGRAFVVHALPDDLGRGVGEKRKGSLKTGNAGARLACGIIYFA